MVARGDVLGEFPAGALLRGAIYDTGASPLSFPGGRSDPADGVARATRARAPGNYDFTGWSQSPGEGETYVKGYLSENPRVRYINRDARPTYKGFLSVELKDKHGDPLWSYLATPRRYGAEDVNQNLALQVVDQLVLFLAKSPHPPTP